MHKETKTSLLVLEVSVHNSQYRFLSVCKWRDIWTWGGVGEWCACACVCVCQAWGGGLRGGNFLQDHIRFLNLPDRPAETVCSWCVWDGIGAGAEGGWA